MQYEDFIKSKVIISEDYGFNVDESELSASLKPHQKDICLWSLRGGRRAVFANFGLGKTFMQLEIAKQCIKKVNKPFLIVCPLAVSGEFKRDNRKLDTGYNITYITDTDTVHNYEPQIFITNYERVRMGDIDPSKFCGVSFDEASILRNLKTETTNYVIKYFQQVPYRFVATATPTPNDLIEILNYAVFLNVASRGHLLTRFFQRDSTKAGHLTIYPNKEKEFWQWVSTWAVFVVYPSNLGYSDEGYILPPLNIVEHCVNVNNKESYINKDGKAVFFKDISKSLLDVAREKREGISDRILEVEKVVKNLIKSLNFSNLKDGKEAIPKGILREEQRRFIGEAAGEKPATLPTKQSVLQREEQTMEGAEPGKDEGASESAPRPSEMERVSEELLPDQQREGSPKNKVEQVEECLRYNPGSIRCDATKSEREMSYLQPYSQRGIEEQEGKFGCGSLPQHEQSEGIIMPPLQCGFGAVSGQCRNNEESDRLPEQLIIWCDLNSEQLELEKMLKRNNLSYVSIYGGESANIREQKMERWRNNEVDVFLSKTIMYGSGINMQQACKMIYTGITYKFQDFLQGIHRIYRFGQSKQVGVHIIYTQNEYDVLKVLFEKWENHKKLQKNMIELVKEYGLNKEIIKQQMERQIFKNGKKIIIGGATLYNNDTVTVHQEMTSNSVDMILTSIPFGDHYEYSDNYNDFGHNHGNVNFFKQMDFLTPNLLRVLKPGHVAAIHVKDRIRYSYQNGTSFTTISDFSGQTVSHFEKHGFFLMGKITVTTDVVRENNQTYRLGWSEQCKDATKMGCGMPEYILLFRKAPTETKNAYADEPVIKDKKDYTRATWQLDAHAYYRSNGDRFMTYDELKKFDLQRIFKAWERHNKESIYNYKEHLRTCEYLEEFDKLSSLFMSLPVHSNSEMVWTDINRMNTLNTNQVNGKREKHICPLQIDIIERLINRYTMKGDVVNDPFGGLFSTAYKAIEMGRKAISVELNSDYFKDGCFYVNTINHKINVPTLFDLMQEAV